MHAEIRKLIRHAATYGVQRVLSKGISFLLIPLYTRFLTPTDYGVMEILNVAMGLLGIVAGLGLGNALMRFYYAAESDERRAESSASIALFLLGLGAGLTAVLFVGARPWSRILLGSPDHDALIRLAAAAFFFSFTADSGWVLLRARQRSGLYAVLLQSGLILQIGLTVYFVAARRMGVSGVLWATVTSSAIQWAVLLSMTLLRTGIHLSRERVVAAVRFGAPLIFMWIAAFALNYSDRFFLRRYVDLSQLGIYALAYKFGYMISLLGVQPFLLIWEAQCYEVAKREDAAAVFRSIFQMLIGGLLTLHFGMGLFIQEAYALMVGREFAEGWELVPWIALAYVLHGVAVFFDAGLMIRDRSRSIGMIGAAAMVLCTCLNGVLIKFWGTWGACAATVASFGFLAVSTMVLSQRVFPLVCGWPRVLRLAAVSGGLLLAALAFQDLPMAPRIALKIVLALVFVAAARTTLFPHVRLTEAIRNLRSLATSKVTP